MKLLGKKDRERLAKLAKRVNETSNADFVKRLLDERRKYLVNEDGSFSTHELAYRDDGKGNAVVYPQVQNVLGGLHRFDDDMAYDRALYRGDTLQMRTPDARLFTENYKQEYPMYFQPELAPVGDLTSAYNLAPPDARPLWTNQYLYDPSSPVDEPVPEPVVDLFSDEAIARRALKQRDAGVDISNSTDWVEGLNKETRNYIKYLAFDEDIPDSTVYTNAAFEKAAADRGFASGGKIHIKPSKRGTFTAAAKAHGKSVQGFASQVLAHKENYSPAMVKKANFARNASKWHHGDGGILDRYDGDAVRLALAKLRQGNRYDGESKKTGLLRRLSNLPVKVPNMTGTATGSATGLRDIPLMDSTVGREAAVAGTALVSPLAGHLLNVLGNPAAALTESGAALSSLADAYGLVSGLNEVSQDADKAIAGYYGADDIPHTLLNGFAFLPGSSQFTRAENLAQLSNGWRGLTAYPRGVGKRAAEVAVRMGDAAEVPSRYPEQFFNRTAMRYIFYPKADPDLVYSLPFKYSGESAGNLLNGGAHRGDIVDQFFGKTPVPNASYDRSLLPDRMQEYLLRNYPGRNVPIVDLGDAHTLFRYDSALNPASNEVEMQNLVESLANLGPVRTGVRSGGLYKSGRTVLDPGGFDFMATKIPEGYRIDGLDIWKYKPAEYSKAYLGRWSPKRMIQRAGLRFIDSQGTPIIHKWHETVPNLSGR